MKKLLVVAAFLGLGAVVYAKVIRTKPEEAACERLNDLCGKRMDVTDVGECREALDEAADIFGDKAMDKAVDCMETADSCMEAVGCMAGAGTHALHELQQGYERARK